MDNDNVLLEREFNMTVAGTSYKVKAAAVFMGHGFNLAPRIEAQGLYQINFTFRNQDAEVWQPDKAQYSREEAKRAAESAFNSGQVETYAKSNIQTWINIGL
jgi:hypothetical protein